MPTEHFPAPEICRDPASVASSARGTVAIASASSQRASRGRRSRALSSSAAMTQQRPQLLGQFDQDHGCSRPDADGSVARVGSVVSAAASSRQACTVPVSSSRAPAPGQASRD